LFNKTISCSGWLHEILTFATMEIFQPDFGLFFWTIFTFGIFLLLMKKLAWGPLLEILNKRDKTIAESLSMAEKARQEYAKLEQEQQRMLKEAQEERNKILKTARDERNKLLADAREEALKTTAKLIDEAKREIAKEKEDAINELKNEIAKFSLEIAELILRQKLENDKVQKEIIDQYLKEIKLN